MKTFISILCLAVTLQTSWAAQITKMQDVFIRSGGLPANEDDLLKVHFVDIGGGDAILIDTPGDKKILIDAGWAYQERAAAKREYEAYLDKFLEDDVIDLVIISHADYDHFAGLADLVDSHQIRQVWYNGYDSPDLSASWRTLVTKIQQKGTVLFISPFQEMFEIGSQIRVDSAGTFGKTDDVVLTLINGRRQVDAHAYGSGRSIGESIRRNSSSLVFRMDFGETSFLFTGDTNGRDKDSNDDDECEDQELLMVEGHEHMLSPIFQKLDCDVLKVPHHGSNGSSSLRFLKAISPEWAVVSAGRPYGHPHAGPLRRLKHTDVGLTDAHILRTDSGDPNTGSGGEADLGDDCYIFKIDVTGIVAIEKWNVQP